MSCKFVNLNYNKGDICLENLLKYIKLQEFKEKEKRKIINKLIEEQEFKEKEKRKIINKLIEEQEFKEKEKIKSKKIKNKNKMKK
jgi:hypothetical protein